MELQTLHGFRDELEKIAKRRKTEKAPERTDGQRILGGLGGGAAVLGANTAGALGGMKMMHDPAQRWTEPSIQNMAQQMGHKGPLGVSMPERMNWTDPMTQPHYRPAGMMGEANPVVNIPQGTHASAAAHEVGHAINHERWGKVIGRKNLGMLSGTLANKVGIPSAIGTSVYAGGADKPSYVPALANAAIWAPRMADEGMASARAAKYLMKQHGLMKGLGKSMPLAPAFASYGALAGTPLAITAIRRHRLAKQQEAMAGA